MRGSSSLVHLRRIASAIAIAWMVLLGLVFAARVGFPLELEWMEGGSLQQARRMQLGEPVYGPPSAEFVPFLYTPLYPALLALLGFVFPLDFVLARMVSIASVIGIGLGMWRILRFEGKPNAHALLAIGVFCSGYVFGFRWLDIARGDSLFLALTVWSLALLRESRDDWSNAAMAGALLALAFWTKQTAAVFVIASAVAVLFVAPRRLWIHAGAIAAIAGGGVLIGQSMTDGWLWTWIYESHQAHAFNEERFRSKTWGMFVHAAPFLLCFGFVLLSNFVAQLARQAANFARQPGAESPSLSWWRRVRLVLREHGGTVYWTVIACAAGLVSALGYSTQFAEPNAFLPGIVFGSLLLGILLPVGDERPTRARSLELLGLGAGALHMLFALLIEPTYQPIQDRGIAGIPASYRWQELGRTVPSSEQRAAASSLRRRIEAQPALLALHRPWWSMLGGGPGHVGAMGLNDVGAAERAEIQAELRRRIAASEVDAIWIEGEVPKWMGGALRGWSVALRLHGDARVRPMSGWMSEAGMVTPWRGEQLLLVREPALVEHVPPTAEVIADFEDGTTSGFEVVRGQAFPRRAVRSIEPGLPPIGPHGGRRLLSSAASPRRLAGNGEVRSAPIELAAGDVIEVRVGTSGNAEGLGLEIVDEHGQRVALELPETAYDLAPVRWTVPNEWAGRTARIHAIDDSAESALFLDDLWRFPVDDPTL